MCFTLFNNEVAPFPSVMWGVVSNACIISLFFSTSAVQSNSRPEIVIAIETTDYFRRKRGFRHHTE
jgi:hypothetical protein